MITKHTPGPWVIFSDKGVALHVMPAGRPGDICHMASLAQRSNDEINANAALIAAAPTMLAMLEALAPIIDTLGSLHNYNEEFQHKVADIVLGLDCLIKLAKGDS